MRDRSWKILSEFPLPAVWLRLLAGSLVLLLAIAEGHSQQFRRTTYRDAYDAGYLDGFEAGSQDQREGRSFQLVNKGAFQQARRGFDPALHRLDVYRVAYRRGFKDGHEIGYRGWEEGNFAQRRGRLGPTSSPTLKRFRDPTGPVTIPPGTEIRVRLLQRLSTRGNEPGDHFRTEILEDVLVGSKVAIPRGARIVGVISRLKKAGRFGRQSEMNLRFSQLKMSGHPPTPINALLVSVLETPSDLTSSGEAKVEEDADLRGEDAALPPRRGIGPLVGMIRGSRGKATVRGGQQATGGAQVTGGWHVDLAPQTELRIRLERKLVLSGSNPR